MKFNEKLFMLIQEYKVSKAKLAKGIGISRGTLYNYLNDIQDEIPFNKAVAFSEFFGITLDELLKDVDDPKVAKIKHDWTHALDFRNEDVAVEIPIYGSVPAGTPFEAIEDIRGSIYIPKSYFMGGKEFIALDVTGDSMYPKYIEGDTLIIELTPDFNNGDDVIAYVNGYEATVKKIYKNSNGTVTLHPINPIYPERTFGPGDDEIRVLGVVREFRRKV